jgi:hypothetical protein
MQQKNRFNFVGIITEAGKICASFLHCD